MGKKGRKNRGLRVVKQVEPPSVENPVCPACGFRDDLVELIGADSTSGVLYECSKCEVQFMLEDIQLDLEEDDDDATAEANINSGVVARDFNNADATAPRCEICHGRDGTGRDGKPCMACGPSKKKKKDDKDYQSEPMFGTMEELTDVTVAR